MPGSIKCNIICPGQHLLFAYEATDLLELIKLETCGPKHSLLSRNVL